MMKNLIILSVLLLIAVSSYAQNISGSLNSEDAKAMKPVPSAFSAADNMSADKTQVINKVACVAFDENSIGIEKAEAEIEKASSFKPVPATDSDVQLREDQGGGTNVGVPDAWKPVYDKSIKGGIVPAAPAFDKNVPFEYVPQEKESIVPEKAREAL